MAYRPLIYKTLERTKLGSLLQRVNPNLTRVQPKSEIYPNQGFLEKTSLFNPKTILKFYELAPLFIIVGSAVAGLFYCIVRNGITRDDVRFKSSGKMLCEELGEATPRKFIVFNQKYTVPDGLREALAALKDPNEDKEQTTPAAAAPEK